MARWQPSPFIWGSAVVHGGLFGLMALDPATWPWAVGALVTDHAALAAAGMWPRSRLLGPNLRELPREAAARGEIALTFDDGPDPEITPRVLDLLDAAGAKGSFFVVGERADRHSRLVIEMAHRGHAVENHTVRHSPHFPWYGVRRLTGELAHASALVEALTGRRPRFFRPPAGLRSPLLEPVLASLELSLVSWTRRGFDAVRRDPEQVWRRLAPAVRPGAILLLHDGPGQRAVLDVLPRVLAEASKRSLRFVAPLPGKAPAR
jgi:peptidoglycan/xylan/chitin deacetylase (PgdA/CDA1 family)